MHIHSVPRFLGALLLVGTMTAVTAAGQFTAALLDPGELTEERTNRWNSFHEAVGAAARTDGEGRTVRELRVQGEERLKQASEAIAKLEREKHVTRMRLAGVLQRLENFRAHYGVDPENPEAVAQFIDSQRAAFSKGLRWYGLTRVADSAEADPILSRLLTASLTERAQRYVYARAVQDAHMRVLSLAQEMTVFPETVAALRNEHETLLGSYHSALAEEDTAQRMIAMSDSRLQEIKQIAAAVEQRIRDMQQELALYDERIRQRAEGDLIALGLISERRKSGRGTPTFIWPVVGRITAEFLDHDYEEFFGIPHRAVDIAQSQGSIVRSTADGVVHYVQHGGASGYSYVLLGHRDGFATLYGHLLAIHVQPGDDVYQGQTIGLSGGQPGTDGAGPMTTGSHLHFEVIKDGVHIDPLTILP